MKHTFRLLVILIFTSVQIFAQQLKTFDEQKDLISEYFLKKGEVYFRFFSNSKTEIQSLSNIISIDNVQDRIINYEVTAYANKDELLNFSFFNRKFEILKHPGDGIGIKTTDNIDEITGWDSYPTYDAYVTMMYQFSQNYPDLCQTIDAGNTIQGRKILFVKITDSVGVRKPKPRFMYSSSIHGDEITGYVLMLRLIDTLLKGYGTDSKITNLVKNVEIWINPNANPDGTYYGGNHTVNNARRYNANNKDLNRNFPDPVSGPNPTGAWEPETMIMMNLMTQYNFSLSMNFHGGAEVFNYPFDCKYPLHPDDTWFIRTGRHYVDTVHSYSPSTYMDGLFGYPNLPGIVNGAAWYVIHGGRQDYMTYFKGGREITLEISNTKLLPPAQLPAHWNYNFRSFLNFIKESLYGIRGTVKDSVTGQPIKAKIYVLGQTDTSWIFSDSICGDYHRMINQGSYSIKFSAPNYYEKTVSGIQVTNDSTTILNVVLRSNVTSLNRNDEIINDFELFQNYPNPFNPVTNIKFRIFKSDFVKINIYDLTGKMIKSLLQKRLNPGVHSVRFEAENLPSGIYFYNISVNKSVKSGKMLLIK